MRDAADRTLTRPRHRGPVAVAAVAVLAGVGTLAVLAIQPPKARTGAVPATEFSAGRAFQQVQTIATEPHPTGSSANDAVRERLLTALRGDGLTPRVQDAVSVQGGELSAGAGGIGLAHVRNVVTVIPAPSRPGESSSSPTTTRCRPARVATTTRPASPRCWK